MHQLRAPQTGFVPFGKEDGLRKFQLVVSEVRREVEEGVFVTTYGFNGNTPGPVLAVYEGERVKVALHNRLEEAMLFRCPGLTVSGCAEGVAGEDEVLVPAGEIREAEVVIRKKGTFLYRADVLRRIEDKVEPDAYQDGIRNAGLVGLLVAVPEQADVQWDYLLVLQEWAVNGHGGGLLTVNGLGERMTAPLRVGKGEQVRVRLANLSRDVRHLQVQGQAFRVTGEDGVKMALPCGRQTLDVRPGEIRLVEFVSDDPDNGPVIENSNSPLFVFDNR
jgi:manganese oxidase